MDGPSRVGDTVRRPRCANTEFAQRVLRLLESVGVTWAPRALGIDAEGREVVSWIDGDAAASGADIELSALVGFVRELHDATEEMTAGHECVIHDDLQPRNVIVRGRTPVGIIDWEQARPGARVEDVAKLCWSFCEPAPTSDPSELGRHWRRVCDLYDLRDRAVVVQTVIDGMATCVDDIERGAAAGSLRHRVLAERGDHVAIGQMLSWTRRNRSVLERTIRAAH